MRNESHTQAFLSKQSLEIGSMTVEHSMITDNNSMNAQFSSFIRHHIHGYIGYPHIFKYQYHYGFIYLFIHEFNKPLNK